MDLPHIVRDKLLHEVAEQQQQHLAQVFHAAAVATATTDNSTGGTARTHRSDIGRMKSTEHSPLLLPSPNGAHVVAIALDKVDEILTAEEKEAVATDAKLSISAIVREESRLLIALAIPLVLTSLIEFVPSTLLSMMSGHVDPTQSTQILAAFNIINPIQMFVISLYSGLASAVGTFCSQSFGGKRMVELWLYCQAGLIACAICMPIAVTALLSGASILKALGQDPAISDIAGTILLVAVPAVPLDAICAVITSGLQAQNIVLPFIVSTFVGWSVGCTIAYLLAFHTSLGYLGIATAAPICSLVKLLVLLYVVLHNKVFQQSWPGWQLKSALTLLTKVATLGGSSVLMIVFLNLGFAVTSILAGLLPNASIMITANAIFMTTVQIALLQLSGAAVGGAIRIGNALGAGKARRASIVSHIMVATTLTISSINAVVTLFIAKPLAVAFTPDEAAIGASLKLTHRMVALVPILGFIVAIQCILTACGKQLVVAKLNFVCMFAISAALGWLFSTQFDGGLSGLWLGSLVGTSLAMGYGIVWLRTVSWERLAQEAKHNTRIPVDESTETVDAAAAF